MDLVAPFAAAYALMRTVGQGPVFFGQVFLLLVAACQLVGMYDGVVPVVLQAGNVASGTLLLAAALLEVRLHRADLRIGAAALLTMLMAFAIWNAGQHGSCDPESLLQAHAAWHLLGAVAAYLLFCFWASEPAQPADPPGLRDAPVGAARGLTTRSGRHRLRGMSEAPPDRALRHPEIGERGVNLECAGPPVAPHGQKAPTCVAPTYYVCGSGLDDLLIGPY